MYMRDAKGPHNINAAHESEEGIQGVDIDPIKAEFLLEDTIQSSLRIVKNVSVESNLYTHICCMDEIF